MTGPIVVFGGGGFVGSAIARAAVGASKRVVSVTRRGAAPAWCAAQPWSAKVEWTTGDALDPSTYEAALSGASAVVIAVGTPPLPFVDEAWQRKMNGQTNVAAIEAAAAADVPRLVLVNATLPSWAAAGYRKGKADAEAAAVAYAAGDGRRALVLKPGAVSGTRRDLAVPLPLWVALSPLTAAMTQFRGATEAACRAVPLLDGALVPPAPVEALAAAALAHIGDAGAGAAVTTLDPYAIVAAGK